MALLNNKAVEITDEEVVFQFLRIMVHLGWAWNSTPYVSEELTRRASLTLDPKTEDLANLLEYALDNKWVEVNFRQNGTNEVYPYFRRSREGLNEFGDLCKDRERLLQQCEARS